MSIDSISLEPLFTPLVQVSWKDYCRGVDEGCLKLISERMWELIIQFYESWNRAAKPWTRSYLVTCSITYPPYKGIIHCWRGCFTFVLRDILEGSYFSWVLLSYRTSSWRACFLITFWSYFQFISPTWKYSSAAITSCFRQLLDPSWWSLLISDSDLAHLISNSSPARAALGAWADLQRITDERALLWAFLCHQLQSPSVSSALEQPTLMLWEVSEQTLSCSSPAAPCMAVPNTKYLGVPTPTVPRCTAGEGRRGAVHSRAQAVAWWPHPSPPPALLSSHMNYGPILSTATESLKTWTRCKVSPEFTDSLEAITLGGINCSFHRNKMLTGGKPCCSRHSSINATTAAGKRGICGISFRNAHPRASLPACSSGSPIQMYPPDMVPLPEPEGDWLSPCTAQGSPGPEVFGEGCGQRCTVLLGDLNKTSVCHCFGLFIAFSCSLLQHFILRSLVILPCRVQQKCSLLLVYVFQLRLPNNLWSSQSTFPSDVRPDARASFPASCHHKLSCSTLSCFSSKNKLTLLWFEVKSHIMTL